MRWSQWRAKSPFKDSVAPKVMSAVDSALAIVGADPDPECWVIWGDDPKVRYLLFVPTLSGLVQLNVRVAVPGEGPRASGKVVRWNRVQLGELAVEIQAGHRLVTFQVEAQPLNGADAAADAISAFALALFAAADGRPAPTARAVAKRRAGGSATAARSGTTARSGAATKSAATAATRSGATAAGVKPATPTRSAATPAPMRRLAPPKGAGR
jgi:hypothetical protein